MNRTPWTSHSSLPSDRIKPPSAVRQNKPAKDEPVSKSIAVLKLEKQLKALASNTGSTKDTKGGCFCLARIHSLSSYTPVCLACGLILCHLNLPHFACPHCSRSLLTASQRTELKTSLETQISETLANEALAREQELERIRQEAGAFPALVPQNGHRASPEPTKAKGNAVISLNSKTKKVTKSSSSTSSRAASLPESEDESILRVPPPSVSRSIGKHDPFRPWQNFRGDGVKYIPLSSKSKNDKIL